MKAMTDAHVSSHSHIHSARLRLAHQDLQQCYAWHIACGRVGRGRQPPPDEGLQSQQPSQRGSKHHLSRRGRCSRPRHQWQSRCAAVTSRRATRSRHRCRCCNGDNSGDVGSGDDGGSKSSSDGLAALHQHEQDRLGRARVGERARDPASSEVANVDNVGFLHFLLKISGIEGCLRLYIPGFTHVLHRM